MAGSPGSGARATSRRWASAPRQDRPASMERLRLLWVTPDLPRPGVSAARERWWSLLARLARRHDVTLLAFVDPEESAAQSALPAGLADVHLVPKARFTPDDPQGLLPQAVAGGYADPALRRAIAERLQAAPLHLAQYEFVEMANLIPPSDVPAILTIHQLGFAAQAARWRAEGRTVARGAVHLHRYLRDLDFELRAAARAHHVITMSPEDAARLRRFLPDLPVSVSPVGVDCTVVRPVPPPDGCRSELLFVGNFVHPPNGDAVRFLATEVLPRLDPAIRLRVVGHGADAVTEGRARLDAVGPVDDVRPWLAGARVVVAPVRFGTGMRGKVLEALAMARPVVTTSIGAEGLGATPGRHLLVADDAAAFAAAVRRILDDGALARQLGGEGRALVESRFDWDVVAAAHDEIYARVLRAARAGTRPIGARRFGIPATPRVRGWPAVAIGALRLSGRGLAWHARRLARLRAPHPAPGAPAERHVALPG
jgi:glycosyltransferase involved in cell wall biosynthesis